MKRIFLKRYDMDQRSFVLKILLVAEAVVSARFLLFSIPGVISRMSLQTASIPNMEDRFLSLISILALLYLVISVTSLLGLKMWRLFHYLGAAAALVLTIVFLNSFSVNRSTFKLFYFLPVCLTMAGALYIFSCKADLK